MAAGELDTPRVRGNTKRYKETRYYSLHIIGVVGLVRVHVVIRHWADRPLLHDLKRRAKPPNVSTDTAGPR